MIKYEKIKSLKACKSNLEFIHTFYQIFKETLANNLGILEYDYFIHKLADGEYNQIRYDLEDMATKAKIKVLECIEDDCKDEVFESRYRNIKELEDLITYFIEEKV